MCGVVCGVVCGVSCDVLDDANPESNPVAKQRGLQCEGLQCKGCKGVWYCSQTCCNQDKGVDYEAEDFSDPDEEEEGEAMGLMAKGLGHTQVVCKCIKEALEDEEER